MIISLFGANTSTPKSQASYGEVGARGALLSLRCGVPPN